MEITDKTKCPECGRTLIKNQDRKACIKHGLQYEHWSREEMKSQ